MNVTIDGRALVAQPGETILQVARRHGIGIPTLCHDDQLTHFTSCFVCAVEVQGIGRLVPSCSTPVFDNMVVITRGGRIAASRRTCLNLLMSEHTGDCVAPCTRACPAGIDIPAYLAAVAADDPCVALAIIRRVNPFPAVCGYVCPHPCEDECRRVVLESPVAIDNCKRYAADEEQAGRIAPPDIAPGTPSGKRVAVIGAGPGGLTAAYYLSLLGHAVTVCEQMPKAGGMLRYGIPEYRLPNKILDFEIALLQRSGFTIRCGVTLGRDLTLAQLRAEHDAVLIAHGAWRHNPMRVPGEDAAGVVSGIGFLREVQEGGRAAGSLAGQRVVVVGGGNTAIDAARTALRLGAASVIISYRRGKAEMPCHAAEVQQAEDEGVVLELLTGPQAVELSDGCASGLRVVRMALGEPDASGRRRPVEVPGSEFLIPADLIISAIGQSIDLQVLGDDGKTIAAKSWVNADERLGTTALPGVFACGDAVSGPATVIAAIGAGGRAARAIDLFLQGMPVVAPRAPYNSSRGDNAAIPRSIYADRESVPRLPMAERNPQQRVRDMFPVDATYAATQARQEAGRCLSCSCSVADDCRLRDLATLHADAVNPLAGERIMVPVDSRHPHIERDPNKCIKCGRCVRACAELEKLTVFGFQQRGFAVTVAPPFGLSLQHAGCSDCNKCVATCPTGALTRRGPY